MSFFSFSTKSHAQPARVRRPAASVSPPSQRALLTQARLLKAVNVISQQAPGAHPMALENGLVVARFFKYRLSSRFVLLRDQHGRAAGWYAHTAAVAPDGIELPMRRLYRLAEHYGTVAKLDQLCQTLHALNYFVAHASTAERRLYLSVHPYSTTEQAAFSRHAFLSVLTALDITPASLSLILPAEHLAGAAAGVVAGYRAHGFRIGYAMTATTAVEYVSRLPRADYWFVDEEDAAGATGLAGAASARGIALLAR
ncbi:hypothetical protein [Paludibacterium sp.]|uniref:hypothetical protein n=1 Tax=Paludibacterium sp. TaxID=1917523 RepID=UPI0025DE0D60|nr:hypothetical protein [Paludibacterium sp.]MBV8649262.1 hypothetical protein [Paludibacterium sp.]